MEELGIIVDNSMAPLIYVDKLMVAELSDQIPWNTTLSKSDWVHTYFKEIAPMEFAVWID